MRANPRIFVGIGVATFVVVGALRLYDALGARPGKHKDDASLEEHASEASAAVRSDAASSTTAKAPSPAVEVAERWPNPVTLEVPRMGTRVRFVAYPGARDEGWIRAAFADALARMDELAAKLSSYETTSVPSRLNAEPERWLLLDDDTRAILEKALELGRASGGAFDITHQTLAPLWRFGSASDREPAPPTRAEVEALLPFIGLDRVELDGTRARVRTGTRIGLDGITKGYIVDAAVEVLRARGLRDFLVQAGGDLYGAGARPDGSPWTSGIRDPRGPEESFFARLRIGDQAFSTAGDYARFFFHEGRRYHHILDTKSGTPARRCRSVTVLAPTALLADALDDALFVLGPEEGLALLARYPNAEAVLVDAENRVIVSEGLRGRLEVLHEPTPGP